MTQEMGVEAPDPGVIGDAGEDLAEALGGFEERSFVGRKQWSLGAQVLSLAEVPL